MAKEKNKIKEELKKEFTWQMHPSRHFKIIVWIFFFVFIVLASFGLCVFYQVKDLDAKKDPNVVQAPMPKIDQTKLDYVLSEYKQKNNTLNSAMYISSPDSNPGR